jgi:hypothetical protein
MADPATQVLLPEVEVRRALGDRALCFRLIAPPYRAVGVGTLRLLRLAERGGVTELCAGYDRYERLPEETK